MSVVTGFEDGIDDGAEPLETPAERISPVEVPFIVGTGETVGPESGALIPDDPASSSPVEVVFVASEIVPVPLDPAESGALELDEAATSELVGVAKVDVAAAEPV